ncbi:MAG TPA: zinc ribbon domain-containing protein, partial [Polyangiaceae bacterium]|nr:zinc ribbon domain-containing protein [Polyangiaceae bacterium]
TQEGDELGFVGGGRVYKTNQCYDDMPTLARESHSRDPSGKQWRTHCATPAGDPRRATMNTLVAVTSDKHIDVLETGRYEISLADGKCTADVKRTRSYDLVQAVAPAPTVTATATATATAAPKCEHPGEAARLEVRPSRKLMKTGETFTFHALVLDASGCATQTPTTWSVEGATSGVTVDGSGTVAVAGDAPEGNATVVATAAGKSAKVTIEVSSPAHYADLLASSGLNAAGESDAASTVVIATSSIGGADAKTEDGSKRRRAVFIAVVVGVSVLLGIVALFARRRSKKAAALEREAQERHEEKMREFDDRQRKRAEEHAAQVRAHEESVKRAEEVKARRTTAGAMECPSCRRELPSGSQFCPHDGSKLVPQGRAGAPLGNICPVCRRGYDAQTKVCPADGEELVPQAVYAATAAPPPTKPKGKICPTCGGRFEGEAAFCGKDGTALVLLN